MLKYIYIIKENAFQIGKPLYAKNRTSLTQYSLYACIITYFMGTNIITHIGSIIFTLIILLGLIVLIKEKKQAHLFDSEKKYFYIILAYLCIHFISLSYNSLIINRFDFSISDMDQQLRLLLIIPFALLFRQKKLPCSTFWISVNIGAWLSGFYAIYQLLVYSTLRATGSYHPIAFADISLALAFLSFSSLSYFRFNNKFFSLLPILSFFFGLSATILSGSRGALIALPIFVLVMLIQYKSQKYLLLLLLIAASLLLYQVDKANNFYMKKRLVSTYTNLIQTKQLWDSGKPSKEIRFDLWHSAYHVIKRHPLIGIGQEAFQNETKKLIEHKIIPNNKKSISYETHNQLLFDATACGLSGGIFSFLLFLYPCYIFFLQILKRNKMAYSGVIFVMAFFMFGLTEDIFLRNIYITFYVIGLAFLFYVINTDSYYEANEQ